MSTGTIDRIDQRPSSDFLVSPIAQYRTGTVLLSATQGREGGARGAPPSESLDHERGLVHAASLFRLGARHNDDDPSARTMDRIHLSTATAASATARAHRPLYSSLPATGKPAGIHRSEKAHTALDSAYGWEAPQTPREASRAER